MSEGNGGNDATSNWEKIITAAGKGPFGIVSLIVLVIMALANLAAWSIPEDQRFLILIASLIILFIFTLSVIFVQYQKMHIDDNRYRQIESGPYRKWASDIAGNTFVAIEGYIRNEDKETQIEAWSGQLNAVNKASEGENENIIQLSDIYNERIRSLISQGDAQIAVMVNRKMEEIQSS